MWEAFYMLMKTVLKHNETKPDDIVRVAIKDVGHAEWHEYKASEVPKNLLNTHCEYNGFTYIFDHTKYFL